MRMTMKKFAYSILAFAAILSVSCSKEQEAPVAPVPAGTHTVSIKATIAPGTRTTYENDKTFSWKAGDVIQVMTLSADETSLRMVEFTADAEGPVTTFTGEVEDGYTLWGNAFYTARESYVAFGGEGDNNIYLNFPPFTYVDGDQEKYYTVDSDNPLMNMPLTGYKSENDDTYVFQTATGAVKFTFEDLPEGVAYLAIEGSENFLSGMFAFDNEGVVRMENYRPGTYTSTSGSTLNYANRYVAYHFERSADGSGSLYIPLPVGEIPAGARLDFYDEDLENVLYSRSLRAAVPVERNRVTEVASFSATQEWVSMGNGYFYDLPIFYTMAEEAGADEDAHYSMPAVEFFQDPNMPGVYRIENPYPKAAELTGYTISDDFAAKMDDYLYITVLKDNTVVYDDIYTGYSSEGDHVFAGCPANWMTVTNGYNFVAKYQEDGTPQEIILSPIYLASSGSGYYFAFNQNSWRYMWTTIIFPGIEEQIDLNLEVAFSEVADDNPAQPIAQVELSLGENTNIAAVDLIIARSEEEAEALIAAGQATRVEEEGTHLVNFPAEAPSGDYFAYAKIVPSEGLTPNCALLFWDETEIEYFRSDEDRQIQIEDVIGNYTTVTDYYNSGWTSGATLTMVVEESDDPLSGDIMITSFVPEYAKALIPKGTPKMETIYATLDSVTGVVTIASGQTAFSASILKYSVGGYPTQGDDLTWRVTEPGVLFSKHYIGFYRGSTFAGVLDEGTTFTRSDVAAGAPRRIMHKTTDPAPGTKTGEISVRSYSTMHASSGPQVRYEGTPSKIGR